MSTVILKLKRSNEPTLPDSLKHAGIKGMKWGVRRYQNSDGSLTDAGKARYLKQFRTAGKEAYDSTYRKTYDRELNKAAARGETDARIIEARARSVADATANAAMRDAQYHWEFDIDKEVQKDREAAETIVKETGNLAKTASDAVNKVRINVPKMDLSNMTDQQLREQIARARLEGEYDAVFNPERAKVERGKAMATNVINGIGTATAIAGSALGIAIMVKQLKGG